MFLIQYVICCTFCLLCQLMWAQTKLKWFVWFYVCQTTPVTALNQCRREEAIIIDCCLIQIWQSVLWQSHSSETVIQFTSTKVNKMILFLKQASQQSLWKSSPQRWQRYNSLPVSQRVERDSIQSETMPIRRLNWHLITTLKRLMGH